MSACEWIMGIVSDLWFHAGQHGDRPLQFMVSARHLAIGPRILILPRGLEGMGYW